MDRADTEVKWPKWALAVLFLVDGAGFGSRDLECGGSRYKNGSWSGHLRHRYDRLLWLFNGTADDRVARRHDWAAPGDGSHRALRDHYRSWTDFLSLAINITILKRRSCNNRSLNPFD
jgi:hypothetical protein